MATEDVRDLTPLWWCSFADDDGFRGVVVIDGRDPIDAVRRTHELGVNPGGEVVIVPVRRDVPARFRDRLLTEAETNALNQLGEELS